MLSLSKIGKNIMLKMKIVNRQKHHALAKLNEIILYFFLLLSYLLNLKVISIIYFSIYKDYFNVSHLQYTK